IAFSGVRSSWDMLARNSDLWRLAASSRRLLSAISRKSRAFWIARADWVANVLSNSTTSGENSPGVFRVRDRLPMIWSSRSSGTDRAALYLCADEHVAMTALVRAWLPDVGHLDGLTHLRRPSHDPLAL